MVLGIMDDGTRYSDIDCPQCGEMGPHYLRPHYLGTEPDDSLFICADCEFKFRDSLPT